MKFVFMFLMASTLLHAGGVQDAKIYHNNSQMQWNVYVQTLDQTSWNGSERILDIGCGDGKITAIIASKVENGSVLGVDISQAMIDFASLLYPQTNYPNLSFQRQDATEISFESQFDCIVSFSTLHWVLNQEKALTAIYRALIPGGHICLQTYGNGPMNVTSIGDLLVHSEKWAPYFPNYTKQRVLFSKEEYHTLLEYVGFEQIQVDEFWNDTLFADQQGLFDFAKPILNFIKHLPENLQVEFVEEVVERIMAIAGVSDDGMIHYLTLNLRAVAKR